MVERNNRYTPYPANTPIKGEVFGGTSAPVEHLKRIEGQSSELQKALVLMETAAATFAETCINDPALRLKYIKAVRDSADELIALVKARKMTPHQAAQQANAYRNQMMAATRAKLTPYGLIDSIKRKEKGVELATLENDKAEKRFGRKFEQLSQSEKEAIWREIIASSGKTNEEYNLKLRRYRAAGRTLAVFTVSVAVYNIYTSDDKARETAKQATGISAGIAGGAMAAAGVGLVASGPPGWVVGMAMFVGAALAGAASDKAFDFLWPEDQSVPRANE